MSTQPNILFINTDQQTWDALSAFGNHYVQTPNMDRLQRNGVSFMRSYCTDPVCCPARSSWATGRYTSETGVPFNGGILHTEIPDIGQQLTQAGYNAYHCGKWHVTGRDVTQSFRTLYYGAHRIGAGGAEFHDPAITHACLQFLTSYDESRPFYLQIGYVNPHDICEYGHNHEEKQIPDPVAQGILDEAELPPLPSNFDYDREETLLHQVVRRDDNALIHWPILQRARTWSELQWRYLAWNLYRFVEKVDTEIGLVLDILAAGPHRDNTVVIFGGDHGEAAGRHQMFQKFTLYEESVRVPLIASSLGDGFGLNKGVCDQEHLISGVDVHATICDYAGIEKPEGTHGRSFKPLAEGASIPWREAVYIESNYWGRAVVTRQYKYVTEYRPAYPENYVPPRADSSQRGKEQLFDLQADAWETRNVAGDPTKAAILASLRAELGKQEKELTSPPLEPGRPRDLVDQWGQKLRDRWAKEQEGERG